MTIHLKEEKQIMILEVYGEFTLTYTPIFTELMYSLIQKEKFKVIVNLENIAAIDSIGLGIIIAFYNSLDKLSGGLKLLNISSKIQRLFNMNKIQDFIPTYTSLDNAVSAFNQRSL